MPTIEIPKIELTLVYFDVVLRHNNSNANNQYPLSLKDEVFLLVQFTAILF